MTQIFIPWERSCYQSSFAKNKVPNFRNLGTQQKRMILSSRSCIFTFSLFNKLKPGDVEFGACIRQVFGVTVGLQNTRGLVSVFFFFNTPLHLKVVLPNPQWKPRETLIIDTERWQGCLLREQRGRTLVDHGSECPRKIFRGQAFFCPV